MPFKAGMLFIYVSYAFKVMQVEVEYPVAIDS